MAGADSVFGTCDIRSRYSGGFGKDQCSAELAETEECVRDSQLSRFSRLLQALCVGLFLDSRTPHVTNEEGHQFLVDSRL